MGRAAVHQALRYWLDDSPIRPPIRDDSTQYILVQRLGGLLYHIGGHLSEANTQFCRTIWQQNTTRYLSQIAVLGQLPSGCVENCLAVKGTDYIENMYRDPGSRQSADLDLIADSALRHRIQETFTIDSLRSSDDDSVGIEQNGCLIEVHNTFAPLSLSNLNWNTLIHNGELRIIDGQPYRFPCPIDRLTIWLVNQAKSSFIDGLWAYVDLALILKTLRYGPKPMSWKGLKEHAACVDLAVAFELALGRLNQFDIWPFEALPRFTRGSEILRRLLTTPNTPHPLPSIWQRQGLRFVLTRRGFRRHYAYTVLKKLMA